MCHAELANPPGHGRQTPNPTSTTTATRYCNFLACLCEATNIPVPRNQNQISDILFDRGQVQPMLLRAQWVHPNGLYLLQQKQIVLNVCDFSSEQVACHSSSKLGSMPV